MFVSVADSSHKEVIAKASKAAGSLVDTEFDIRFNPDVFSEGVTHLNPEVSINKKNNVSLCLTLVIGPTTFLEPFSAPWLPWRSEGFF